MKLVLIMEFLNFNLCYLHHILTGESSSSKDIKLILKSSRMSQREYQILSTTSLPKVASVGEGLNGIDHTLLPPCQRMGIMTAFTNFDQFKSSV